MTTLDIAVRLLIVIAALLVSLVTVQALTRKIEAYQRLRRFWAIRRQREEKAVWALLSSVRTRGNNR